MDQSLIKLSHSPASGQAESNMNLQMKKKIHEDQVASIQNEQNQLAMPDLKDISHLVMVNGGNGCSNSNSQKGFHIQRGPSKS